MRQGLSTKGAARILRLSPERVKQLENAGILPAWAKNERGERLFSQASVEKLAAERAKLRKAA